MKQKIKPPSQPKAQLMAEITAIMQERYPMNPVGAIEYLLNFFTGADLVGIRDELQREKR